MQYLQLFVTVQVFYGAGGQNPKSFFPSFSDEILEAAFNVPIPLPVYCVFYVSCDYSNVSFCRRDEID